MNTFYILSLIWVLIGLGTFVYLFFESAPYGRHIKEGWGIEIPARLGWVIMESPSVILMIIYALIVRDQLQIIHKVFLLLMRFDLFFCRYISKSSTRLCESEGFL